MVDKEIKREVAAWNKAIAIIDASEEQVRSIIERELMYVAGVSGTRYGDAMRAADVTMAKVRRVRTRAIKRAFQYLKETLS